jgi:hypothetical protein
MDQRKDSKPERRRYGRHKVEFAVKVHLSQDGKASSCQGTGTNVGECGIQLFISRDLAVGQTIRLELSLPYDRTTLNLHAVVRNRLGFKYGVEFRNPTERDRQIILQNCKVLALFSHEGNSSFTASCSARRPPMGMKVRFLTPIDSK